MRNLPVPQQGFPLQPRLPSKSWNRQPYPPNLKDCGSRGKLSIWDWQHLSVIQNGDMKVLQHIALLSGKATNVLGLAVAVAVCLGCSPENKLGRQPVTGTISVNGELLDRGSILFAPTDLNGVSSGAEIENGTYTIPAHQGLTTGTYTVRIYATDVEAEEVAPTLPGPGVKTQPERIPAAYNMKSKLRLEVTNEPAVFDLDIESKRKK